MNLHVRIAELAGKPDERGANIPDDLLALIEREAAAAGDEVDRYLRGRGLTLNRHPPVLRFHPSLGYFEKVEVETPAVPASITA